MAKDFAKDFYRSSAWENCRTSFIIHKGGLCERCLEKGIVKPGIIVHHKIYLTPTNINNPDVTLNWDNLQLLCIDCHNKEHSAKMPIAEGLMFDDDGNLVKIISPPGNAK